MKSRLFCPLVFLFCTMCLPLTAQAAELFVADRATNRVLSFDEESGDFLRVVTATGLDEPSGLAFGPGGFLYVSNAAGFPGGAASVVKVDPITGSTTAFITDVIGAGGVAFHEESNTLFVSEFGNFNGDEVFRYNALGALVQTLGGSLTNPSPPTARSGMTFDAAGNLYVSEFNIVGFGSVLKYDYVAPGGSLSDDYETSFTTFASGADVTLAIPAPASGFNGLAFDDDGNLFVASLIGQSLIKYFVAEGEVVQGIPFGAPLPYPSGVIIGADGNILVTSLGNDNPADPFYGPNVFPGNISRFHSTTFGTSPFLKGDVNRDTVVDGADLAAWQAFYGEAYNAQMNADLDGDFDTDGRDFLLWQRGYGNSGVAGGFQPTGMARYEPIIADIVSVPEPTCMALWAVVLGGGTLFCRRREG
jgi:hypothetical protein